MYFCTIKVENIAKGIKGKPLWYENSYFFQLTLHEVRLQDIKREEFVNILTT